MTDAEREFIEAALNQPRDWPAERMNLAFGGHIQRIAQERMSPAIVAELKQKLRAEMRAHRELTDFQAKLPGVALYGERGLVCQLYEEIEKEEGWK